MPTLENRIMALERTIAAAVRKRPMPFFRLPPAGDHRRADVLADIAMREQAGQACIIYEIV